MKIDEKLNDFEKKGVKLWSEDGKLKYKTVAGTLSKDDFAFLKANKKEIILLLEERTNTEKFIINAEERYEPFMLTDVQQAYLLGRSKAFKYGNVACHIYMELQYKSLDTKRVEEIWNLLIKRHEMLRAVIYPDGYQQILPETCHFIVLEYTAEQRPEIAMEMSRRVYQTSQWPLFGVAVSKDTKKAIMHLSMEFLIADWTSIWMLLSEFEKLYFEKDAKLPEAKLSFRDYVISAYKMRESVAYERDKQYWLNRAETFFEAPKIPRLRGSDNEQKSTFSRHNMHLSKTEWEALKKKAAAYGITPTVVTLTIYAAVLALYSTSKKFTINLTVLNRLPLHAGIDNIVGDFTSVSPLETDFSVGTFIDKMKAVSGRLFEDLDHRLFTGIELMREITKVRGKDAAFMPYVFTSAIGLLRSINGAALKGIDTGGGISQTPQVFIDCQVMDGEFGFQANWDVRDGVFSDGMIEDMFSLFTDTMRHFASEDSDWTSYAMKRPAWQKKIIDMANHTEYKFDRHLLHEKIIAAAELYPEKTAMECGDKKINYREMMAGTAAVYKALKEAGCCPGENIIVFMEKFFAQIQAVLAVLSAECVYVPVSIETPVKRLENILKQTDCRFLLADNELRSEIDWRGHVLNVGLLEPVQEKLPVKGDGSKPAYIIFTSGSTGTPKGVVISHQSAVNTIEDINRRLHVTSKDAVLGISELNFDLSVYDIFGVLSEGGILVLPENEEKKNPSYLAQLINSHHVTLWNSVPAYMTMLMAYAMPIEQYLFPSVRAILLSGDYIPLALPDDCLKKMPNAAVYSLGGATEAAIWSIIYEYKGLIPGLPTIPYGKPLANQGFRILDETLCDVPMLVPGELYITGEGLAIEYFKNPEITSQNFFHHPDDGQRLYRTGDYGRYLTDGNIEFLGRKDEQIKINGYRIELGEIEDAFMKSTAVQRAVAVVSGKQDDKKVAVFLQGKNAEEYDIAKANAVWETVTMHIDTDSESYFKNITKSDVDKITTIRDKAILATMVSVLKQLIFTETDVLSKTDILTHASIKPEYRWILDYWLHLLVHNGYLIQTESQQYKLVNQMYEDNEALWQQVYYECSKDVISEIFLKYIENSCRNLIPLLTGKVDPIEVLYPHGDDTITQEMYVNNRMSKYLNSCICEMVSRVASDGRTLHILEVGAGTGATTRQVLKRLQDRKMEYWFTDCANYFLVGAQKKFAGYKGVRYRLLDIDRDCREQGMPEDYFDIIIAAGVLENAKNIRYSLRQIHKMITPSGFFMFTEPVLQEPWILVSQAFLMTKPEDEIREANAFISSEMWCFLLNELDEKTPQIVLPKSTHKTASLGLRLFVKQLKCDRKEINLSEVKKTAEKYLLPYMLPSKIQVLDKFPLTFNGKTNKNQLKIWAQLEDAHQETIGINVLTGMEAKLQEIWNATGVKNLSADDNFYKHGADSLIMAQAASKIRETVAKGISYDELLRQILNYPTIKELAEFINERNNIRDQSIKQQKKQNDNTFADSNGVFTFYGGGEDRLRVVFHAALGTMNCFHYLIPHLIAQNMGQVMGITIKDVGKYLQIEPDQIASSLADDYAEHIAEMGYRKIQLIGYSYAGWLAFEVGNRLTERGFEIEDTVVIDGQMVPYVVDDPLMVELLYLPNIYVSMEQACDIPKEDLEYAIKFLVKGYNKIPDEVQLKIRGDEILDKVAAALTRMKALSSEKRFEKYVKMSRDNTGNEMNVDMALSMFRTFMHTFKSAHYGSHPYIGDVRYILATEFTGMFYNLDKTLSYWENLCLGNFTVFKIEGNHYTCIGTDSNAEKLAKIILRGLQ